MLRARGREVADECASDTDDRVDDCDVEAPPPRGVDEQLGREVHAECSPGYVDTELSPTQTDASVLVVSTGNGHDVLSQSPRTGIC